MVTSKELYLHIKKVLSGNGIESPEFEAMCFSEHIFKKKLPDILISRDTVTREQVNYADSLLIRRCQGEPLQYLLGKWEFYGLEFYVGEGVLIPRQDTEILVDKALSLLAASTDKCLTVLDLCSGSGCIAVTVKTRFPQFRVAAVEISEKAIGYINKNAELHHAGIETVNADVLEKSTAESFGDIDMILCNPPYLTEKDMDELQKEVTYEPELALFGGGDGLRFYRKIIPLWKRALKKDGVMLFETGMGQTGAVGEIFEKNSFTDIEIWDDLCGIHRVVKGKNGGIG